VMQRNCHEFIAYENLVGSRRFHDRGQRPTPGSVAQTPVEQVVPLVRRALKVLADREVTPQLGLLKSTLLQLDSTFSERTYGAGSFRDFAQKLSAAGHVTLREAGRNVLVELRENGPAPAPRDDDGGVRAIDEPPMRDAAPMPTNGAGRAADGIREIRRILLTSPKPPRWPMYIRQLKQFLRNVEATFDERKYGFETLGDLMRACQREGLLRIERDRQGGMRIFPGNISQPPPEPVEPSFDEPIETQAEPVAAVEDVWVPPAVEASVDAEAEVVDGNVLQDREIPSIVDAEEAPVAEKPSRRRRPSTNRRASGEPRTRKTADGSATTANRPRKTPSKPRGGRNRPRNDAATE
jgi:hypothetical protein